MRDAAIEVNRIDEANEIVNLVRVTSRQKKRKLVTKPAAERISNLWEVRSMVKAVAEDTVLSTLLTWKNSRGNQRPDWSSVATLGKELKFYFRTWPNWKVDERGLIWYKWYDPNDTTFRWKLVVPKAYQDPVMKLLHNVPTSGHLGEKRTLSILRAADVFWFNCKKDIRLYCRACDSCFRSKHSGRPFKRPMQSFTAGEPLERMGIDVAGPFHTSKAGNKYILVAMDYFTKYVVVMAMPNHRAPTVARNLVDHVFTRIGIPTSIHSDQGTDFLSRLFKETCQLLQIHKTRTSPWRPQSDGMVERFNRTIDSMLKQFVCKDQTDWDKYLSLCCLAYNSTIHSSTGYSPNYLMFGRDFQLPLNLVLPTPDPKPHAEPEEPEPIDHFVKRLGETIERVYQLARENAEQATRVQKKYYDSRARHVTFKVADSVWLYNPIRKKGRTPKLDMSWQGPYAITNLIGGVLAEIKQSRRSKARIVHVDKLAHTKTPIDMSWVKSLPAKNEFKSSDEVLLDIRKLFESEAKLDKSTSKVETSKTKHMTGTTDTTEKPSEECNNNKKIPCTTKPEMGPVASSKKITRSGREY